MKSMAWMVMAACLALGACGGDDVSSAGGASVGGGSNGGASGGSGGTGNVRPMLAMLPSGGAVLARRQSNSTQPALWTAACSGGAWTSVNQAVSNTSLFATLMSPAAGIDAQGHITLVWGQLDAANGKLMTTTMARRYSGGRWQGGAGLIGWILPFRSSGTSARCPWPA